MRQVDEASLCFACARRLQEISDEAFAAVCKNCNKQFCMKCASLTFRESLGLLSGLKRAAPQNAEANSKRGSKSGRNPAKEKPTEKINKTSKLIFEIDICWKCNGLPAYEQNRMVMAQTLIDEIFGTSDMNVQDEPVITREALFAQKKIADELGDLMLNFFYNGLYQAFKKYLAITLHIVNQHYIMI